VSEDPFDRLTEAERDKLRPAPRPDKVTPMKALLTDERFSDPDWIYERKLDGIRCVAIKADKRVRLLSRNDLSLNGRFPEVADGLERDAAIDFVADGEVVAFAGRQTSFARLTQRGERHVPVFYYVFDLLYLAGRVAAAAARVAVG
jgi:ATP-dependent DNA ligase